MRSFGTLSHFPVFDRFFTQIWYDFARLTRPESRNMTSLDNKSLNQRYTLQRKIGQGGMGIVYEATDRLTGHTVALKQVVLQSAQLLLGGGSPAQMLQELRLALAHEFRLL